MSIRFLLVIFLGINYLFAQEKQKPASIHPTNAFQLKINNYQSLISLSPFYGTIFSIKHHFDAKYAFRFGLSFSYLESHEISERVLWQNDFDPEKKKSNFDSYQKGFGSNLDFIYYLKYQSVVQLYCGTGPGFFLSEQKKGRPPLDFKVFHWRALIGAEWFIKQKLSVALEYVFYFEYYKLSRKEAFPGNIYFKKNYTKTAFLRKPIFLVVSIYF